ncbi:DNA polymerase III subunit delta [Varunaivibrio sulfuroxidans]|uniref:DNA-directed DNA polymerase n=1 Tax=Varunaivibrio sulfuroxidans TaxID=1773489 RepID=A0A4R3JJ30_9PROT|nr:DNA polymerase III subunit delta [Varunaivibrio sulfuroxidans]TCS64850.1 DNA polymerase III delta subunit [Varunaivibrio sulfuroxidans]WES29850.1 DNA polymerase III subunit delta [Varunaivibrio sulfuroxidans]
MKIAPRAIDAFVQAPPANVRAVLIYGQDDGLVRERSDMLVKTQVADPGDPFCTVNLKASSLKTDPARLGDEANALSFGGGGRVVTVDEGADSLAPIFADFLKRATPQSALVIITAPALPARSKLRTLFEKTPNAAALACYADDSRTLGDLIRKTLAPLNMKPSADAMAFLLHNLGSDRALTRNELEKLVLYKGGPGTISLEDVRAAIGDSAASSLDDVVYACAGGNLQALDGAIARAFEDGNPPVKILRAQSYHFMRIHQAVSDVQSGQSPAMAVKALRPPVFYKFVDPFTEHVRLWAGKKRLSRALDRLLEAEMDCKTTGIPDQAVCARALMAIAQIARR